MRPLQTCRRENIGYLADVVLGVCVILSTTPRRKGRGSLDRRVRVPRSSMGRGVFTLNELSPHCVLPAQCSSERHSIIPLSMVWTLFVRKSSGQAFFPMELLGWPDLVFWRWRNLGGRPLGSTEHSNRTSLLQ
jgi:hypothetical protein